MRDGSEEPIAFRSKTPQSTNEEHVEPSRAFLVGCTVVIGIVLLISITDMVLNSPTHHQRPDAAARTH